MSDPFGDMSRVGDLDAALAGLAEERRKLKELHEKVTDTSTVVHSKDRILSMTFDGRGELDKLTFNGARYRSMPSAELAALIKATLTAGRNQAMEKLGSMVGSDVLPGVKFEDLATGKVDFNDVIESFLGVALDGVPDRVLGRSIEPRLRGES